MSELDQFDVSYVILRKKITIVGHFTKIEAPKRVNSTTLKKSTYNRLLIKLWMNEIETAVAENHCLKNEYIWQYPPSLQYLDHQF